MKHASEREGQIAFKFEDTAHLPYAVRKNLPNEQRRKALPTRDELIEAFDLDWQTGQLINRRTRGRAIKGKEAGTIDGVCRKRPYRRVKLNGESYLAHHLVYVIAYGELPAGYELDHINGDTLHNVPENLRHVRHAENMKNLPLSSRNTSGAIGVIYDAKSQTWRAWVKADGKTIQLGRFDTLDEARAAREKAQVKYGYTENHGRKVA